LPGIYFLFFPEKWNKVPGAPRFAEPALYGTIYFCNLFFVKCWSCFLLSSWLKGMKCLMN